MTGELPHHSQENNEVSTRNIKSEIKDAASVEKNLYQYVDKELDTVASGKFLKVQIKVIPESQFPMWATTFASMLCANPELANLTNKELAALIENESGETGFNYTIISKKLSEGQRHHAGEILRKHGYATDTLVKGTDIKRIVKDDVRTEALKDDGVVFHADGVSMGRKRYAYRQRAVTPSGKPWHDFCIRLAGDDTSLQAFLAARTIGINDFVSRDEAARATASPEEAARRHKLERQATESRRLTKIMSADGANRNGAGAIADFKAMHTPDRCLQWTSDGLMACAQ
ncbi:hypothetical protein [Paraburkholderia sp. RL17-337-BIB-A]|uniref:hypothetical protein n=1 Tax=Paraburkholderia sp. RL17-337-BIB-A TaxID=3031636 RepID=UPI0038BDCED8